MSASSAMAFSLSSGVMCTLFIAGCLVIFMLDRKPTKKPKCMAKRRDCAYTTRIFVDGEWGCPLGFDEDTGCDWSHGPVKGKLQCRACGPNNPYVAYQDTNTNCPAGFRPCNQAPFNYGDLKRNANGEYYYDKGWGVDDPNYNETDGLHPYGGTILLNKGKWGGTDAHPELFARGCCAWGNSADDPERDKANKVVKIATFLTSVAADIGGVLAAIPSGGASIAAAMALHGASAGVGFGGRGIKAKCGGPTELYKKTKRNYIFKAPYKDGMKMRGRQGLWYTANDGCPLKWLQYIPPNQRLVPTTVPTT